MTDNDNFVTNPVLEQAIDDLFSRLAADPSNQITEYDVDWPSPCEQGSHWVDDGGSALIRWQPHQREAPYLDFQHLEKALEFPLHADVKIHYGKYYSANLLGHTDDGDLTLLYLWNQADGERLIENLIGHAVACRNNKTPFSVFFAVAEPDSDYFLTINNVSGEIQLERPGYKPERTLATDLAAFVKTINPGWRDGSH